MSPKLTFTAAIFVIALSLVPVSAGAQGRGGEGRQRSGERTVQGASASRQDTGRQATTRSSGIRQSPAPQPMSQGSGNRQSSAPQTMSRGNGNQPAAPQMTPRATDNRQSRAPQPMSQGSGNRQPSAPQTMSRGNGNQQPTAPQMAPRPSDNRQYSTRQAVPRGSVTGPRAPGGMPPANNRYESRGGYGPSYQGPYVRPRNFQMYRPFSFSRPYYSFRARLNIGFGVWLGFTVPYPWTYFGDYRPRVYGYYPDGYYGAVPGVRYYGGLSFDIQPSDGDLWVDGEYVGMVGMFTPYGEPLTLLPGVHRIAIVREGFRTMEWDVRVEPGVVLPYRGVMEPW